GDDGAADFNSNIHVSGTGGGTIHIRGGQLVMDYGRMFADTLGAGTGEQINIQVSGDMLLKNEAKISTDTLGLGTSGDINVQAGTLTIEGGSMIKSEQWAVGAFDSGNVTVTATESINISGKSVATLPGQTSGESSGIYAVTIGDGNTGNILVTAPEITVEQDGHIQAMTTDDGNAGNITMNVTNLSLASGGQIDSVTRGAGTAGKVDVNATGTVTITGSGDGSSGVYANTFSTGDGGVIEIDAAILTVQNDGKIQAFVGVDNSNPSLASPTAATQAGTITLNVDDLNVTSGAQILAQTTGDGQAGSISITATDSMTINSTSADTLTSGIYSTSTGSGQGGSITLSAGSLGISGGAVNVSSSNTGDAGTITANVSSLTMTKGAQFSTSTAGSGNGGDLTVTATNDVLISGEDQSNFSSGLYSLVTGTGTGGDINLSGANIRITQDGTIDARSTGTGDAGNITVTASDLFEMKNSSITTEALLADGGNIKINADNTVYMLNSVMTAAVGTGSGNGGNINIDPVFVIMDGSQILANAYGGDGGNINIVTEHYIATPDSVLDASSALGIDGTVNIESPDVDMSSGITELTDSFLDAIALLRQKCGARNISNQSSFFVSGRSAIPMGPDSMMPVASSLFTGSIGVEKNQGNMGDLALVGMNKHTRPIMAQGCSVAL
ncbi:MAG: S-layer family protein, partial [Gammaproteobacteria bacterium]|nr:S-layer family protein [Gammaproteobacteria bacterium]